MSFPVRFGLVAAVCAAAVVAGCSMAPFQVDGSETAVSTASAGAGDLLPRLRPRAIGVCYSPSFNDPADIEAEAAYLCAGGRLERLDEDAFWNGCSLSQPHRVSYVCYPADRVKELRGAAAPDPATSQ
ncbi:MAG: hypothetical protein ACFCUW_02855 [Kiloniellaceae bacterium]